MSGASSSWREFISAKEFEDMIPLDKSWMIRMGILDLAAGSSATIDYLRSYKGKLGNDLRALLKSSQQWLAGEDIEVGESGTLYRFLQVLAWSKDEARVFVTSGTLRNRSVANNPDIIQMPVEKLLQLDGSTSQWASAVVLLTDATTNKLKSIPYKLALSIEAKNHWLECSAADKPWSPRKDATIQKQAVTYVEYITTKRVRFAPEQAEDFCFALAFDLMSIEEGARRWPQLSGHESNRLVSVTESIQQMKNGQFITCADHRVVQAIAMRYGLEQSQFTNPGCVAKSWPEFWRFRDAVLQLS